MTDITNTPELQTKHFDRPGTMDSFRNIPVLDKNEQNTLLEKAQNGDDEAKNSLILHNMRLVLSIAEKYTPTAKNKSYLEFDDLVMVGYESLLKACDAYNKEKSKGAAFSTYAATCIKTAMYRATLSSTNNIQVPVNLMSDAERVEKHLESSLDKVTEASFKKALSAAGCNQDPVDIRTISEATSAVSLDLPIGEADSESTYQDLIANDQESVEDKAIFNYNHELARSAIEDLTDIQQKVIKDRNGLNGGIPKTIEEISKELNKPFATIRKIEATAISSLRKNPKMVALAKRERKEYIW